MRRLRLEAGVGPGRATGFHVHLESGRARGSLTLALAVPREPENSLDAILTQLHDPCGPLDIDTRLGRIAGQAPEGTAFLVGQEDQIWVFPSARVLARRVRDGSEELLQEPQVLPLRPGDRVELMLASEIEALATVEWKLELAATEPIEAPMRAPGATLARSVAFVLAALGKFLFWGGKVEPRVDAHSAAFSQRVVGLMTHETTGGDKTPAEPEVRLARAAPETEPAPSPPASPAASEPAASPVNSPDEGESRPWAFRADGPITSSPLLVEGRVVFGSRDSTVYCLEAVSGETLWTLPTESGVGSSPRAQGGVCFFGTYSGDVFAVDWRTGGVVWRAEAGGRIVSPPCLVAGLAIFGAYDRSVYAFDTKTGAKRWTVPVGGIVRAAAEPIGSDTIVIGSAAGTLYSLAAADGSVVWKRPTRSAILAAAAYDPESGHLVVGGQNATALCLRARTGEVVWSASLDSEINAQPRFAGGTVLLGTGKGQLHALDASSGEALWNVTAERGFDARPLVLGGLVIAPTFDGVVHVLDLADGTVRERRRVGAEVYTSPAAGLGSFYLGTLAGMFYSMPLP